MVLLSGGRSGRTRTRDLRFWRPLLYQLSYTPALTSASGVGGSVMSGSQGRRTSILRARRSGRSSRGRPLCSQSARGRAPVSSARASQRASAGDSRPKATCKPSSVPGRTLVYIRRGGLPPMWRAGGDHLSSPSVAGRVERPTRGWAPTRRSPGVSSDGDSRTGHPGPPIRPCSGWGLPGLRCYHRSGELLPRRFTLTPPSREGRYVSVALSVGSPRPAVSGHPARWSSDFPPSFLGTSPWEGRRSPGYLEPTHFSTALMPRKEHRKKGGRHRECHLE